MVVTACLAVGCGNNGDSVPASYKTLASQQDATLNYGGRPMIVVDADVPMDEKDYIFAISAEVIPIAAPYGSISRTERIWRYLDEQIGHEPVMAALHHNGFRVARGKMSQWPQLRKVLRELTGETAHATNNVIAPSKRLEVELGRRRGAGSMFYFDEAGRLSGRDYPAGELILSLEFRMNPDRPGDLIVHAAPQIKSVPKNRIEVGPLGATRVLRSDYITVGNLEFTVALPQDYYLVIGPGAAVERESSPGGQFLLSQQKGLKSESVIIIAPRVFAAEIDQQKNLTPWRPDSHFGDREVIISPIEGDPGEFTPATAIENAPAASPAVSAGANKESSAGKAASNARESQKREPADER